MRSIRSIHPQTMAKLLREHFTGDILPTYPFGEQKTLISQIKANVEKHPGIRVRPDYRYSPDKDREERILHFCLEDQAYFYHPFCAVTLKFDTENHLIIEDLPHHALVYQLEQIDTFIDKLQEEFDKKKAHAHKKDKINNLKQQAIIARIKEIAKEDRFEFIPSRGYLNKLKVLIRMKGGILLEVDIPYNNFQEVLNQLRPLIHNVKELQKLGIAFKIKFDSGYKGRGWITPDNVDDDSLGEDDDDAED